jgi:Uma2 family endonuclease
MASAAIPFVSREAYLEADRKAEFRSEYVDGVVYAMSGGSHTHARLIARAGAVLEGLLVDGNCGTSVSDLRLRIGRRNAYVYPDVMVICGEPEYDEGATDIVKNPVLVAEVLSPSTESWDRGGKFARYQTVESLREYVLISQDERRVEWFTKLPDGDWRYAVAEGPGAVCRLTALGVTLPLDELYRKIL